MSCDTAEERLSYFLTSFLSNFFTNMNIIIAKIMKFKAELRKGPQPMLIGPMLNVAVSHCPPMIKGLRKGMTMLSTKDLTRSLVAAPITKATTKAMNW